MKICPASGNECVNYAGCNHVDFCNKPVTIQDFAVESPENKALIDKFKTDLKSGKICLS